jgi:hypothetical protein
MFLSLSLLGWYSRKVGGLLGKMDGEPWSDLSLGNGKRASSLRDMIEAWTIIEDSYSCPLKNSSSSIIMMGGGEGGKRFSATCHSLFYTRSSPLFKCFPTVIDIFSLGVIGSLFSLLYIFSLGNLSRTFLALKWRCKN